MLSTVIGHLLHTWNCPRPWKQKRRGEEELTIGYSGPYEVSKYDSCWELGEGRALGPLKPLVTSLYTI